MILKRGLFSLFLGPKLTLSKGRQDQMGAGRRIKKQAEIKTYKQAEQEKMAEAQ